MRDDQSEDEAAEARQGLAELAEMMGRATAHACHKLGISFDMDEPQVARDVIAAAFEGLILSPAPTRDKDAERSG